MRIPGDIAEIEGGPKIRTNSQEKKFDRLASSFLPKNESPEKMLIASNISTLLQTRHDSIQYHLDS